MTATSTEVGTELPAITYELANKDLIDADLFAHLTARIAKAQNVGLPRAERIMDQALGFLKLCALDPEGKYSPSHTVDIGWHTFVLYTREYAEFCERVAGRFMHHSPYFEETQKGDIQRTAAAMKAHGISVDEDLWDEPACCCLCP